jgi:putative hydrolase of HD superfamily
MENVLEQFFSFATFVEKLKKLERYRGQFYWMDYPEPKEYESVADHTWRLALLVLLFEDRLSRKIDWEKALKMALVHDIAEAIVGDPSPLGAHGTGRDTHAFNKKIEEEKNRQESVAAKELFSKLPVVERKKFHNLWLEYEKQDCFEAKVVKSLDKVESLLQVLEYRNGHMYPKHLDFSINYYHKFLDVDPFITQFIEYLLEKMKKNYKEFKK